MKLDPASVSLTESYKVPGILYALCFDGHESKLYGAGSDWAVYRVDLSTDNPTAEKRWTSHTNYVSALAYLGGIVISASYDGRIIWTDAESSEQVHEIVAHDGWVRDLVLMPGENLLASVGDDMLVKLWNAETGECLNRLDGHAKQTPQGYATTLYALSATPDGKHIASGDRLGAVRIWEAATGELVQSLHAPTFYTYDARKRVRSIGGIRSLCFSPDGSRLAIAGIGQVTNVDGFVGPCRVELWEWQSGKRIQTVQDKHKAVLNDIAFHPREPYLIAAGGGDSGGILAFWDMEQEQLNHKAKPKGHIQRLVLDDWSRQLLMAGYEGFQVWGLSDA